MKRLRDFVRRSALIAGLVLVAGPALGQQQVYVQVGGGDWAVANMKAYVEPFEKATGIKVIPVRDFLSIAKLKLMVENKNVELDVADMPGADYLTARKYGWLEKIDYSIYKPEELAGIAQKDRAEYAVAALYAGYIIAYNTKKYPPGTKRPTTWAEFWDAKNFPGTRAMRAGVYGSGPWEEALLAAGVPADKLFPMDIDAIFKSLDKIKPAMTKWWKEGAESQQLFSDGIIDVGQAFNARTTNLQKQGVPVAIEWNQGKMQVDYWVIPKGAKNREAAQKFIEFATRADRQAAFAELIPYGPSNANAYKYIKPETAKSLPTYPENFKKMFVRDDAWYVEVGPDGKTNHEKLIERWNKWILE